MNTSSVRKQGSFRLSEELLAHLQVEDKPNKVTLAAMKEAEESKKLEQLDMDNFRNFVDSL